MWFGKQCGSVGGGLNSPFPVSSPPFMLASIYDMLSVTYITFNQLEPNTVNKILKYLLPHYVWMF